MRRNVVLHYFEPHNTFIKISGGGRTFLNKTELTFHSLCVNKIQTKISRRPHTCINGLTY